MNEGGQVCLASSSVHAAECRGRGPRQAARPAAFSLLPLPSQRDERAIADGGWFHDFLLLRIINVLLQMRAQLLPGAMDVGVVRQD